MNHDDHMSYTPLTFDLDPVDSVLAPDMNRLSRAGAFQQVIYDPMNIQLKLL